MPTRSAGETVLGFGRTHSLGKLTGEAAEILIRHLESELDDRELEVDYFDY